MEGVDSAFLQVCFAIENIPSGGWELTTSKLERRIETNSKNTIAADKTTDHQVRFLDTQSDV